MKGSRFLPKTLYLPSLTAVARLGQKGESDGERDEGGKRGRKRLEGGGRGKAVPHIEHILWA
jgi:hypothetical protein